MAISPVDKLNAQLKAFESRKEQSLKKANDAITLYQDTRAANNNTVLGKDVGQTVNGIKTLDQMFNPEAGTSTAGQLINVTNESGLTTPWGTININLSAGTYTIGTNSSSIPTLRMDSAGGIPLRDSDGNLIETSNDSDGLDFETPSITSSGTDVPQNNLVLATDLTGYDPPEEAIEIVALGGAAVSQIVSAVGHSEDRKIELLDQIATVASETSAAGVPDDFKDQLERMKDKIKFPFADEMTLDYLNTSYLYGGFISGVQNAPGGGYNFDPTYDHPFAQSVHGMRLPKSAGHRIAIELKIIPSTHLHPQTGGFMRIWNNMPGLQGWNGQFLRWWISEFPMGSPVMGLFGFPLDTRSPNPNPYSWTWTHDPDYWKKDKKTGEYLTEEQIANSVKPSSVIWGIPQDMGNLWLNFALIGPPWKGWSYTPGDPDAGAIGEKEIDVYDYTFGFRSHPAPMAALGKPWEATLIDPLDQEGMDSANKQVLSDVSSILEYGGDVANQEATRTGLALSGLETTIDQVTNTLTDGITGIGGDGFGDLIDNIIDGVDEFIDDVVSDIDTGFGAAQELFEDLTGTATDALTSLLPGIGLAKETVSSIVNLITESQVLALRGDTLGADINLSKATKILLQEDTSFSPEMREAIAEADGITVSGLADDIEKKAAAKGVPIEERQRARTQITNTESALTKLDASIAGQIVDKVGDFYTEDADLAELVQRYTGASTESFAYVDSREELEFEFIGMPRDVSEVILHSTDTYTNANIGSEEIHLRHNDAGHDGIQYHYVIRRDGRLQRGMPIAQPSDASDINGHKANCIDIALVGGVNVPTEADAPDQHLSASSYTQAQMKTLEQVLLAFYQVVPGGQVLGHNDIDAESPDPHFDVPSYVENLFGKKSVYENTLTDASVSLSDLVNKEPVS